MYFEANGTTQHCSSDAAPAVSGICFTRDQETGSPVSAPAIPRWEGERLPPPAVRPDECPEQVDMAALYEQFQPLVRSLMGRYGRTPELRKDLTGEIYYQFCRLVSAYDAARGIPICAYLTHMLPQRIFNHVRDYWRGESRYVSYEQETMERVGDGESGGEWDEALVAEEVLNALPAAIGRLPHRQRLVVVWRYYEDRSFEQIAAQLEIKPATARSLLRHAITALRQRLAQQGLREG